GTGICVANTDEQKKAIRKIKFRIELPRLMSISILAKIYCWGFTYCGDIIRQIIFLWCVIHDLCGKYSGKFADSDIILFNGFNISYSINGNSIFTSFKLYH